MTSVGVWVVSALGLYSVNKHGDGELSVDLFESRYIPIFQFGLFVV